MKQEVDYKDRVTHNEMSDLWFLKVNDEEARDAGQQMRGKFSE